jgi:hypothetical protein
MIGRTHNVSDSFSHPVLYMRVAGRIQHAGALPHMGLQGTQARAAVLRGRRGRAEAAAHELTVVAVQQADGSRGETRMPARRCLGSRPLVHPLSSVCGRNVAARPLAVLQKETLRARAPGRCPACRF